MAHNALITTEGQLSSLTLVPKIGAPNTITSEGNAHKPSTYFRAKRVMDLALALLALVLLAPLLLLIALLIKLTSPGSVFFVQERVGSRRRTVDGVTTWEIHNFPCYKFRSMYQNADQRVHAQQVERWIHPRAGDPEGAWKMHVDNRITPLGRFLRMTSLDELPQLINVVRGEMSLVGPRPVPTYEVAQYGRDDYERLAALPGMTGLWQVMGRADLRFDEQVKLDIEYIGRQSLLFDLKLMFLTVPAVLTSRGAK
jgi:lipopolysaccharide/colanic/teichoic acid biosynthesis glycosyltransferase